MSITIERVHLRVTKQEDFTRAMEREEHEYSSKAESEENEKKLSLEEIHNRYHISEQDKGMESGSNDCRIKRGFQEDCTHCVRSLPRSRYTPTSSDDEEAEEEVNYEWEQYYEDMDIYEELGYVPDEAEDVESNHEIDFTLSCTSLDDLNTMATISFSKDKGTEARTLSASTVEREEYEMATTQEKEVPQNNVKQEQAVDDADAAEASELPTSSVCNSHDERDTTENSSKAEGEEIEKKLSLEEIHNRYHISEEDKGMESGSNDSRIKRGFQEDCTHCLRSLPRCRYTPTSSDDEEEEEEANYEWEQYYEDMDIYEELGYVPDEAEYIESIEARTPSTSTVEREEYEMATTQENPQNNVCPEQFVAAPDVAEASEGPPSSECNTLEERDTTETSSKAEGEKIENKLSLEEIHNRYHISEEDKGMESGSNDSRIKRGFQEDCTHCLRSLPRCRYTPTSSDDEEEEEEVNYDWEHYYADVDLYEEIGYVPDEAGDVESNYTIDLTLSRTSLDELNSKASTSKDN